MSPSGSVCVAEQWAVLCRFGCDLEAYLRSREGPGPSTLQELIAFNNVYKEKELEHFGQEIFVMAQKRREEVGEAEAAEGAAAT